MATPRLTFRFAGQDNIQRALNSMQSIYGPRNTRRVYNTVLKNILTPAVERLREVAPIDTGFSRTLITMRIRTPRRNELQGPNASPDTVIIGEVGYLYRGGVFSIHPLLAIEFGTSRRRASSPLRNTFDKVHGRWQREFIRELEVSTAATQRRLAARLNRQGRNFRRR